MADICLHGIMFIAGYPFETTPSGRNRLDEHVRCTINGNDLVKMGRNRAVNLCIWLRQAHHRMKMKLASECDIDGLRSEQSQGELVDVMRTILEGSRSSCPTK